MKRHNILCGSRSVARLRAVQNVPNVGEIRIMDPNLDEYSVAVHFRDAKDAERLVLALGIAKVDAVLEQFQRDPLSAPEGDWVVVTGDQVVFHNGEILEKPNTPDDVYRMYKAYAHTRNSMGKPISVYTVGSVVLTDVRSRVQVSAIDTAELIFHSEVPENDIAQLFPKCTNCAGGLVVEHPVVSRCVVLQKGSWDTVRGLDSSTLVRLLEELDGKIDSIVSAA